MMNSFNGLYNFIENTVAIRSGYLQIRKYTAANTVHKSNSHSAYLRCTTPVMQAYIDNADYTGFTLNAVDCRLSR